MESGSRDSEGMAELGPEVWSSEGLKVLGSPVGTPEYIQEASQERLAVEADFWRKIPWVPDLRAWQLLVQCAGPRCHHFLRTVPPSLAREYAAGHDQGMEQVMTTLLEGLTGDAQQQDVARRLATLPMRMGGLGLRSARRMAPAAYWASWADAMAMIDGRLPQIADRITAALEGDEAPGCLGEPTRNRSAQPGWLCGSAKLARASARSSSISPSRS